MNLILSSKVMRINTSLTRQLFELAKKFNDVIDLTLGDPDLLPPMKIREAASEAIMNGKTRYSQNAGLMEARESIAKFNSNYYGDEISPSEIMITCGGMEAIFLLLTSLVEDGDEVIIPGPYWVNYKQMTEICGGKAVIVPTKEDNDFLISIESLKRVITKKTRVLIINSPNNPTGRITPVSVLRQIANLARKHNFFIISDEVYRSLVYHNNKHNSIWTIPGIRSRCAVVDSMSKRFSMTGYRLGYAIAPKDLIVAMSRLQENIAACAPLPAQHAAIVGYGENVSISGILKEFLRRRDVIYDGISAIPGLSISKIDGTFYAFVNISGTGMNSYDFSMKLLETQQVAVVPGRTYGALYDDYIRIAFTVNVPKLKKSIKRIAEFVKEYCHVDS